MRSFRAFGKVLPLLSMLALVGCHADANGSASSSTSGGSGSSGSDGTSGSSGTSGTGSSGSTGEGTTGFVHGGHPPVTLHSSCAPGDVFFPPQTLASTLNDTRVTASGDLNNDGATDVVILDNAFEVIMSKGDGGFAPPVQVIGQSLQGEGLVLADVNGDGYLDVVYGAYLEGSSAEGAVAVSINHGDGTFSNSATYSSTIGQTENVIEGIVAGDFNGDKFPDLILTTQGSGLVLMINNGKGGFRAPTPLTGTVGSGSHSMVVADFNGDGKADLATYDDSAGPCVMLGKGDGTFQLQVCYPGSEGILQTEAVLAGDLNGDGKPDLVVMNFDVTRAANIFLNNGDGTFGDFDSFPVEAGGTPYDGILMDVNNDGKLDMVMKMNGAFVTVSFVRVALGNGDGTFDRKPIRMPLADGEAPLMEGDFGGTGLRGFAHANPGGIEALEPLCRPVLPNPAPLFPGAQPAHSSCAPGHVALTAQEVPGTSSQSLLFFADLNGDNRADVLQLGGSNSKSFAYSLSNGDGTFQAVQEVEGSVEGPGMAVGDLNGDGKPDVVYAGFYGGIPGIAISLNAGNGHFHNVKTYPIQTHDGPVITQVLLADVNNDGKLDLFIDSLLFWGRGDGTFAGIGVPTNLPFNSDPSAVQLVDLDGDHRLDVVMLPTSASATYGFCTAKNVGNGNFAPPVCTAPLSNANANSQALAIGDINGDGKVDVVTTNYDATVGITTYLGKGDGTFQAPVVSPLPDAVCRKLQLGDVDNDGKLDAMVSSELSGQMFWLAGDGNGHFGAVSASYPSSASPYNQLAAGDLLGNGLVGFGMTDFQSGNVNLVTATCTP